MVLENRIGDLSGEIGQYGPLIKLAQELQQEQYDDPVYFILSKIKKEFINDLEYRTRKLEETRALKEDVERVHLESKQVNNNLKDLQKEILNNEENMKETIKQIWSKVHFYLILR
jgi:hypothetical protein